MYQFWLAIVISLFVYSQSVWFYVFLCLCLCNKMVFIGCLLGKTECYIYINAIFRKMTADTLTIVVVECLVSVRLCISIHSLLCIFLHLFIMPYLSSRNDLSSSSSFLAVHLSYLSLSFFFFPWYFLFLSLKKFLFTLFISLYLIDAYNPSLLVTYSSHCDQKEKWWKETKCVSRME